MPHLRAEPQSPCLRVLLIEDSPADAELIVAELERGGYDVAWDRVQTAGTMDAALADGEWDVVLSDYDMPHFSGPAALEVLKASGRDLPFVIISGTVGEETAVAALKAGAHDFLIKDRLTRLIPTIKRELGDLAARRERARAQEALEQSEAQYRSLVDRAVFGIFRSTRDGRFITVNPALVAMLRYDTPADLLAVNLSDIYEDPSVRESLLQRVIQHGQIAGEEVVWKPRSGGSIRVRWSGWLLDSPDDPFPNFEVIVEDITDRARLEEQLRQSQKMDAIGQLAGGVAHDFNNLLTAILGYANLLSESLDPADRHRADVQQIASAAERAAGLTKQLLAFSRKQVLKPTAVDLNVLIPSTTEMLRRIIGEHITLVTSLAQDLRPVRADPTQLEQLILNLAVNARDAMPAGGSLTVVVDNVMVDELTAFAHGGIGSGPYVRLVVRDTGVGMDEGTQRRIFEPFFTTKPAGKGTGLGLATVYGIVQQSNGFIGVESQPRQGTTFTICLPVATDADLAESRQEPGVQRPAAGETILVVEDEPAVRTLTRILLERAGYKVLEAETAEAAEKLFVEQAERIDLLVSDVVMPGMQGPALFQHLAAVRHSLKVLFMSGYTDDEMFRSGQIEQGVDVIQKPFTATVLTRKVREVLDR